MFHLETHFAYRDYSILEKFHWWNSKFCEILHLLNQTWRFHPPDILFETTTPTSFPPSLPSFLSVRYKKKVNVVPGFTSLAKLCTRNRVSNMFEFFFPPPPTPPPLNSRGRVYISENFNFRPVLAHENSSITIENYVEI